MKRYLTLLVVTGLLGLLVTAALAQSPMTDSHQVTVTVNEMNAIDVYSGDAPAPLVTLNLSAAIAGADPTPVSDSSASLYWTTNGANKKITVQTSLGTGLFTLKVVATGVSGAGIAVGTPQAELTLSTTPQDFITGIDKAHGTCSLTYTAEATAAAGHGTDTHTITYTLTGGGGT